MAPGMTTRLYYTEPWRREFDAEVVDVTDVGGRRAVRLDRTAFYPTSGGQPFDTGTIGEARVVDVTEDEASGEVQHVIDGAVSVGDRVRGVIDWTRRFDHMQQHTGQHMLSAAFAHGHGVRTESFHLGADVSTIDLAREVSADEIATAEAEANRVVWEDRPVAIRFVAEDEAARLPLRKQPVKSGRLRLIEVEGFDLSACGGTHVSRTGAIGIIAVRGWERFRGGSRLTFVCGRRALGALRALRDSADGAARQLTVHPDELPAAVERLLVERKETQRELRGYVERLARYQGEELAQGAERVGAVAIVVEALEGYDANALKVVGTRLVREPGRIAVLFSRARPALVIALRSGDVASVDCGALVRELFARFGGKGGGRPDLAQGGGLEASPDALVAAARELVGLGRLPPG